jgi:hypothetical protein
MVGSAFNGVTFEAEDLTTVSTEEPSASDEQQSIVQPGLVT